MFAFGDRVQFKVVGTLDASVVTGPQRIPLIRTPADLSGGEGIEQVQFPDDRIVACLQVAQCMFNPQACLP